MNILHITPHLGGGVGKAHATLAEATSPDTGRVSAARRSYALLEPPLDVSYADRIRAAGCDVSVATDLDHLAALAGEADIVQVEWWNHPRLYGALVANKLPDLRLTTWLHISSLVAPLVPRAFVELADHTLFTSPCTFGAANLRDAILDRPGAFDVVGSGFGFTDAIHRARPAGTPLRFGYLGTLDFLKLHPDVFDFIDAVEADIRVHLWGRFDPDGEVARRAASMVHANRIVFEDYTTDPAAVLTNLDVLIYLLAPEHYGTAENALLEAMSAGAVPIVFSNIAEIYIVEDRKTGFIVDSKSDFVSCIESLLRDPSQLEGIRVEAKRTVARRYCPRASLARLEQVYDSVMCQPKRHRDFAAALGKDARSWFLSSLSPSASEDSLGTRLLSHVTSKGSIGHFRSCYPQDQSLDVLGRRSKAV